jgi:uncharacterized membrane protein YccC
MPEEEREAAAVSLGLRVGVAATTCLLVTEWFHLEQSSLSVYTAHLILAQFTFTAFQKGVERFVGRALGVVYGLVLVQLFLDTPFLYLLLMAAGQITACYFYLSGRLAYAALMAALFIGIMVALGLTAPGTAVPYAANVIPQLFLGEAMAFLVNWVTGAERTLAIETKGQDLLPLRTDWLNTSVMLSTGQIAAMFATLLLDLPVLPTMVSALIVGIAPTAGQGMGKKALQRTWGAILGGGYAFGAMVLLALMPYFTLLLALVFVGMFLAAFGTKVSQSSSYVFLQMGLVLPMVLIAPSGGLGSISNAVQRLIGVGVGLLVAEAVFLLWPHPANAVATQPTSAQSSSS